MKTFRWIILSILVANTACSDYGKTKVTDNTVWDKGGEAYYNNVIDLQTQAGEKYETWSKTMDSMEAINKVKQFFLSDTTVTSATIGSQGIAVQYSNGMRGGILINPQNGSVEGASSSGTFENMVKTSTGINSFVNSRKAICLFSVYWQYKDVLDVIERYYTSRLPNVGMNLAAVYKNSMASIDRFTELTGYGIIHIDSHGFAWPSEASISEIYLQTGEVANLNTTIKYWKDVIKGNLTVMLKSFTQLYFLSPEFISSHNDFSKDTVLFFGGFCYSNLGRWPELYKHFGGGGSFGFDWSVNYEKQDEWGRSLIDHLCNEQLMPPGNTGDWIAGLPQKGYWDTRSKRTVSIQYNGNPTLTLWKEPEVETSPVTDVTSTTAKCGGNVKLDGGIPITEKGVCWSTSEQPTTSNSRTLEGGDIGTFINTIDNLTPLTQYWIRAYATTNIGTYYGKQIPFITEEGDKVYKTVTIGTQTWMAENLAYLPTVNPDSSGSETEPRYYVHNYFGNNIDSAKALETYRIYGVLYNLKAASTACPQGWHLPSDTEWQTLEKFLGMSESDAYSDFWRNTGKVGYKMRSTSTLWGGNDSEHGDNSSGFNALPGGYRQPGIYYFMYLGVSADFWTSSWSFSEQGKLLGSWYRSLQGGYDGVFRFFYPGSYGFSVRCVKD